MGTLTGTDLCGLLSGNTYINLHTGQNAPGEICGQVVPEPNGALLALLALGGLAVRRRVVSLLCRIAPSSERALSSRVYWHSARGNCALGGGRRGFLLLER